MVKKCISLLVLVALSIEIGAAVSEEKKIYKWRDANGKLHFSDKPPKELKQSEQRQITIKPGPSASTIQKAKREAAERAKMTKRRQQAFLKQQPSMEEKKLEEAKQQKIKKLCSRARAEKLRMESRGVVYLKDKSGKRINITDEERNALIKEYEKAIQKNCS